MPSVAAFKLCVLWEHELRTAARLLRKFEAAATAPPGDAAERERACVLAGEALRACIVALADLHDDHAVVVSSIPKTSRVRRRS